MEKENDIIIEQPEEKGTQSTVMDVISGRESIKFDVSLSWTTILYVCLAVVLIGIILMYMKKIIMR